jgi:hypothetical protein
VPFTIPDIAIARHPGIIIAPKALQDWADSLPMGNPPRAAQMLLQQVRLLVRDPDPGARFGALLDLYNEPMRRLLEIVTARFDEPLDIALPIDQLESTLIDMLGELANGRLRIANQFIVGGKPVPASLLYTAMDLLDTASNIEHLHYAQRNTARWRQILAIYLHAEQQGIGQEKVALQTRRPSVPDNVRWQFFRALIISLCDPHHHRPIDVLRWHAWLGTHEPKAKLGMLPEGSYSIPVDTSGLLEPLTGARRGKPGPDVRYLAAEAFLQQLEQDDEPPPGLHDALLGLIRGRKSADQRSSPRQDRRHPFRLSHGLRAVHDRLLQLSSGCGGEPALIPPTDATQLNQSKTGAAFRLPGPVQSPVAIGETVLAEADNPKPGGGPIGFVGQIQRAVSTSGGDVEIGVAKLPGRLIPVRLIGACAERARGDIHALLQQEPGTGKYALIAASSVFHAGDTLTVEGSNLKLDLRMRAHRQLTRHVAYLDVEVST